MENLQNGVKIVVMRKTVIRIDAELIYKQRKDILSTNCICCLQRKGNNKKEITDKSMIWTNNSTYSPEQKISGRKQKNRKRISWELLDKLDKLRRVGISNIEETAGSHETTISILKDLLYDSFQNISSKNNTDNPKIVYLSSCSRMTPEENSWVLLKVLSRP